MTDHDWDHDTLTCKRCGVTKEEAANQPPIGPVCMMDYASQDVEPSPANSWKKVDLDKIAKQALAIYKADKQSSAEWHERNAEHVEEFTVTDFPVDDTAFAHHRNPPNNGEWASSVYDILAAGGVGGSNMHPTHSPLTPEEHGTLVSILGARDGESLVDAANRVKYRLDIYDKRFDRQQEENARLKADVKDLDENRNEMLDAIKTYRKRAEDASKVAVEYRNRWEAALEDSLADPPCPQCHAQRCVPCQVADLPDGKVRGKINTLMGRLLDHDLPMPNGLTASIDGGAALWWEDVIGVDAEVFFGPDKLVAWYWGGANGKQLGDSWLGDILGVLDRHVTDRANSSSKPRKRLVSSITRQEPAGFGWNKRGGK